MTREELEHRINVQTLKQVEDHIVHQEVTKRTYPQQQTGTGELSRLWALHEEYVEKVRSSGEALKVEDQSKHQRIGRPMVRPNGAAVADLRDKGASRKERSWAHIAGVLGCSSTSARRAYALHKTAIREG